MKQLPTGSDRLGWHKHYAQLFNRTGRETAAHLAMWYLLLHLSHEEHVEGELAWATDQS